MNRHFYNRTAYNFNKGDYDRFRQLLQQEEWPSEAEDLERCWHRFKEAVISAAEATVPRRKLGSFSKPLWLDHQTLILIKYRNKAWHKYVHSKKPAHLEVYKKLRNRATAATRKARMAFERNLAKTAEASTKSFWRYVNSRTKSNKGVSDLLNEEGVLVTEPVDKAEALSAHYKKVFTREDTPPPEGFEDRTDKVITAHLFTNEEVHKMLSKQKKDKAAGPDAIFPRFLLEGVDQLSKPLCTIFNRSLQDGKLPNDWKLANVSPIFKKGKKEDPANYRPVSLTSCPCKVMESLIRERILGHLEANNLITNSQYGFRKGRSCSLQLLEVVDRWLNSLDRWVPTDVAFLDFSKAFDAVPHQRLLTKLAAYGIKGRILDWLKDFLSGRKQRVVVQDSKSSWECVTSGVPQGSVLGPVLFVIFINDMPDLVESILRLFADDTKVGREMVSQADVAYLQKDLDTLSKWSADWLLPFNVNKCKLMHIGTNNRMAEYSMIKDGQRSLITEVEEEKDLGVTLDNRLSFEKHIYGKVAKANQILGVIRRTFRYLDKEGFVTLYKTMVRPHIEYASSVWSPYLVKHKRSIENVQRRATKMVSELRDLPYSDRLKQLGLPTLEYRRLRADMVQTYRLIHGLDKMTGDNFLELSNQQSGYGTRGNSFKLNKTRTNTTRYARSFKHRVVAEWNVLPDYVVNAPTLNSFKSRLNALWKNHNLKFTNSF